MLPREPAVLGADRARRVPWKNGCGSTLEVASDAASPGEAWTWRLSIADVPARAPFSEFPGVDRAIACLEGEGMRLLHNGAWIAVPRLGVAYTFAGEDAVVGEPEGEGVRDVNLMVRRDRWRAEMRLVRSGDHRATAPLVVVHAAGRDSVAIQCGGADGTLAPGATLVAGGEVDVSAANGLVVVVGLLWPR